MAIEAMENNDFLPKNINRGKVSDNIEFGDVNLGDENEKKSDKKEKDSDNEKVNQFINKIEKSNIQLYDENGNINGAEWAKAFKMLQDEPWKSQEDLETAMNKVFCNGKLNKIKFERGGNITWSTENENDETSVSYINGKGIIRVTNNIGITTAEFSILEPKDELDEMYDHRDRDWGDEDKPEPIDNDDDHGGPGSFPDDDDGSGSFPGD